MLIEITDWLNEVFGKLPGTGMLNYISFRAGVAMVLSLIISMLFGKKIIEKLRRLQVGETVRELGLEGQKEKEGTPTMGGLIIILAILVPSLIMAKLDNVYIILMLLATVWMGFIGFMDDYIKVFKKNKKGLKGRTKLLGQLGLGLIIAVTMLMHRDIVVEMSTQEAMELGISDSKVSDVVVDGKVIESKGNYKTGLTNIPFVKGNNLDYSKILSKSSSGMGWWAWLIFVPLVVVIVMGVSNGANLTDGLDGLATGISGIIGATLGILAYVSGNAIAANYLNILHLPGAGELVIYAACFVGATIGFLWYNSFPASIFMGDTGSLTLGGIIAAMAIVLRKELLIPILCGVFLMENISVMLQVAYFKYTKKRYGEGRRIFQMAPLHHHYQKLGMAETKIVTRFWIVGILLAVLTIITLKIR
ncbi:MAG: phospho-N-acetylmuramoyl-pentapeptide-transferase [Saprospiraceae bacterium]|nr:phospho-N-acetylmuramoyl-pentapeptide-transferase [Saprospiraceae bacterium]MCB9323295.1 phospho-N-acetylmuramoyl-pentapeptide-transferase [Lewinellaceae bacterium]